MGKKQKKQKFIKKILADNKVSKKEVRSAAKKGIKLDRIQKAVRKSTQPGNVFSRSSSPSPFTRGGTPPFTSGGTSRGAIAQGRVTPSQVRKAPTPAAPVIKPGAQTLINRDIAARAATAAAPAPLAPAPITQPGVPQAPPPPEQPVVEPQEPSMEDMFGDMIAGLQGAYEQNIAAQQEQFAAMEAQQQQQMALLQQQMQAQQQSMSAQAQLAGRPSVLGVQYASSRTPAGMGASGAFGRGGMRIRSLNV